MVVRFGGRRKRADKKRRAGLASGGNGSIEPEVEAEESPDWDELDGAVSVISFETTPDQDGEFDRGGEFDRATDSDGPYDLLMESNRFAAEEHAEKHAEEHATSGVMVEVHEVYAVRDDLEEVYAALDNFGDVHEDNHEENHHLYASGDDAHAIYDPGPAQHSYGESHGTYTDRDEVHDVVVQEEQEEVVVQEPVAIPAREELVVDSFSQVAEEPGTTAYVPQPLPRVMAVANQKGGVGKTTTAVNLGAALAELDYRVLVIDLDPQGNATTGLGIDGHSFETSMYDVLMRDVPIEDSIEPTSMKNLFVAPSTIDLAGAEIELVPSFSRELKLRRALEPIAGEFDYILIDCPPSLGLITINGLAAAHEVLVPIQCEYYALEGLGQLLRNVHLVQSNLNEGLEVTTIVLTMFDSRTKLAEQVADEVRTHFGSKVCKNVIPRTVRISEAPSFGQPITVFDSSSRGAIAYRELAKEVSGGKA